MLYMPVVKIFVRLELEQKFLFLDGHYIATLKLLIIKPFKINQHGTEF